MKLNKWSTWSLWLLVSFGLVSLIAYLRILFFYDNGKVNFQGAPVILLFIAVPMLASGIYGLQKRKSFSKQPILIRSAVIGGIIVFAALVIILIAAAASLGLEF